MEQEQVGQETPEGELSLSPECRRYRELRDRLGLSSPQLAELLGVSHTALYKYHRDQIRPPAYQLEKLEARLAERRVEMALLVDQETARDLLAETGGNVRKAIRLGLRPPVRKAVASAA